MCRWISYSGNSIPLERLIVEPKNSLLDQSMSATMSIEPTNADGIGIGWYGRNNRPGLYKSILPAWSDDNLKELAYHVESPLFMAHIRRSTGGSVQSTNCHPFRYSNWMFVHNGEIRDFQSIRRELMMTVAPEYFPYMTGSTDSELIFFLALSFGLQHNPLQALSEAVTLIERLGRANGIEFPFQGTLGITDSKKLYALRYSSEGKAPSLFYSDSVEAMQQLCPESVAEIEFGNNARAVVSEPLGRLPGVWLPVAESTVLIVENGIVELQPFLVG